MQNYDWTITRKVQYNNSKTLNTILQGLNNMISIATDDFINKIINIDTATGNQLDIIGKLVGASRVISFSTTYGGNDFGFDDDDWFGFDDFGGTFDEKEGESTSIILEDNAYRFYIKLKAYANISNCSLGSINYMLQQVFKNRGICYCTQTGATQLTLTFNFDLQDFEKNIITNRYIPIPAGYSLVLVENE